MDGAALSSTQAASARAEAPGSEAAADGAKTPKLILAGGVDQSKRSKEEQEEDEEKREASRDDPQK